MPFSVAIQFHLFYERLIHKKTKLLLVRIIVVPCMSINSTREQYNSYSISISIRTLNIGVFVLYFAKYPKRQPV